MAATEPCLYQTPGEHVLDNMVFYRYITDATLQKVRQFNFKSDDFLVASYPKSGTTWVQKITWLILNGVDAEALGSNLDEKSHFIEVQFPHKEHPEIDEIPQAGWRHLKTHLPPRYFERAIDGLGMKVIVVMRNVRDMLVSYYHFYRSVDMFGPFAGTWDEFFELFRHKRLVSGDWLDMILDWWRLRHKPNVLCVFYEDLKRFPCEVILKIAAHCGRTLSEEQLQKVLEHSSFFQMKKRGKVRRENFFRKGEIGDWVNYFSQEQIRYVEEHIESKAEAAGIIFIK